jgi:predicted component of type VI protein secretion system
MAGETLKVTAGNAAGQDIPLEQELVIGRSTPGQGSLGGDSEISRVHARVYRDASGQLMVEDLGSTNGTFVNGNRISSVTPLRAGDELRVGQTTLGVEGGAAAEGATAVGQPIPPVIAPPPAAPQPPPAAAQPPPAPAQPPTQPLPPAQPPPGAQYGGQPQQQAAYGGGPVGGPPGRQGGGSKAPWIALAAVVLIALIVGGLAIGGVFSSDSKSNNTASTTTTPAPASTTTAPPATSAMPAPPQTPSKPSSTGYPPGFLSKLIQGCDKSGKLTHSQCVCWFTKLKNSYSFPELVTVLQKAKSGSIPPKAVALLRTCLNQ